MPQRAGWAGKHAQGSGWEASRGKWAGCLVRENRRQLNPRRARGSICRKRRPTVCSEGWGCEGGEDLWPRLGKCPGSLRPVGAGGRELELASGAQSAGHGLISSSFPMSPLTLDTDPRHPSPIFTCFQPGVPSWPLTCLGSLRTKLPCEQSLGWFSTSATSATGKA